jgi:hypothetical protein
MLIITKYHPATGSRGSRISAYAPCTTWGRVYVSFPHELSGAERHFVAAKVLLQKAGYLSPGTEWVANAMPGGYAFSSTMGFFEIFHS